MFAVPDWLPLQQLAIVLSVALAGGVVWALERPTDSWGASLRRRFVLGVPWGTLVTIAFVLCVYLFVQGGWDHWYAPVTIPFRAWSYLYPLGILTAPFSHMGPGHLMGNLIGTVTLAPLVEYAWGHFPRERGSSSFGSWRTNPYVRSLLVFPAVVVGVGVLTGAFAVGPIIGFSGVVFAFAGFALVYYPYRTVLALLAGRVVRLVYDAFLNPRTVASASPSYGVPWWAQIAIQGHALGFLVGVVVGIWWLHRRGDEPPTPLRLWTGVLLLGVVQSLWAVYWFRGGQTFVLFRAVGVALVMLLATLVTYAVTASERPVVDLPDVSADAVRSIPRWRVGAVLLLLGAALISGPAVPVNLMRASQEPLPGQTVQVRGYEVTYAENVTSGMVAVLDVSAFGETTDVRTSGVIVRNRRRSLWTTAISKGRLRFTGTRAVRLGGLGWRDRVVANRTGWQTVGGPAAYRVRLTHDGETTTVFTSPPARADPVVAGRNVSIDPAVDDFVVVVSTNNTTVETAPLPGKNETSSAGGVRFVRDKQSLYAVRGDTRVRVATRETYE
ncbi:MAG: rhomboid family intramembrane serine protease [Haloferacaceae archaeon]